MYKLVRFAEKVLNYAPGEEIVLLVNRENQPIGSATRRDMRHSKLLHRSTYVFVENSEGKLYVQMRTATKDVYPSFYEPATGGVVLASDISDEDSARRELEEEIGIKPHDLEFCFNHLYDDGVAPVWCAVFHTKWDGELILQPEEVQWIELMSPQEILIRAASENFCNDTMQILRIMYERGKLK